MQLRSILIYGQLLLRFRNGWRLIRAIRGGPPCDQAVLWDGTRIAHPSGRHGLAEVLVELWLDEPYTRGHFYRPTDGDVIVDAGANIGLFSIWMARRSDRCRVFALEPFPENFHYLQANLRAARLGPERVVPLRIALGKTSGQGRMIAIGERSLDHTMDFGNTTSDGPTVPVTSLAGLFDLTRTDRINLLKVDIEGSEYDAFEEADPALLRRIDRIAIEYHDNIRPGTLALLRASLESTHDCVTQASGVEGCGILLAAKRTGLPSDRGALVPIRSSGVGPRPRTDATGSAA